MLLAVAGMAMAAIALCTQLGLHPLVNPGHHAAEVSDLFTEEGFCKGQPGARLQSELEPDKFMYLCFVKETGRVALWITINRMARECVSRDCTRFFTDAGYIKNAVIKWGYKLIDSSNAPEWFTKLVAP
jgi:hypothetical protein